MFLLPSLFLGLAFALVVGGKLSRLADVRFRAGWLVLLAFGVQVVLFSRLGTWVPPEAVNPSHLATYGLLVVFALANLRIVALLPVLLGMALNATAIAANGGSMPISSAAARAAGLETTEGTNVAEGADRLLFLGDVFALPYQLPYANIFSVGDLLIGFGTMAFVVVASLEKGSGRLSAQRILQPLKNSAYRRLAAGRLVSHLGDWLTIAALVGWVYQETRSTTHVAAIMLVRLAPPILGGGIAAYVVDRLPKERLIVWVELARGGAIALALGGVVADERVVVLGALALSGVLAALSNAAVPALVPSLLPAEQLPAANAGLGMAKDGAMAIGAVAAGLALSLFGVGVALAVDILTFLVAVVCFSGLPAPRPPEEDDEETERVSAVRYLLRRRVLVVLVLSFAAATFATGLTNATLPRLLEEELGLGAGGYGFGMAALAIGLALGGITVGLTRVGPTAGRWIGLGLAMMAGLFVLLGLAEHAPTALLLIALIGFVDGTTDVLFETSVQREADSRHYGAVFGLSSAVMTTTMMAAVALAPVVNGFLDSRRVVVATSAFLLAGGLIAILGMAGGRRREEDDAAPEAEPEPVPATAVLRRGEDLSIVVCGPLAAIAASAVEDVQRELSVEIVSLPATGPWDAAEVLQSVAKTSRVAILHENSGNEIRAAEVAALLADEGFQHLDAPVKRVCFPDQDLTRELRALAAF